MRSQAITNGIQILTGLAMIIGLALVVWELQQTREVAKAQLTTDIFDEGLQISSFKIGEDLPSAFAKACEDPASLTGPDFTALNGYFIAHMYAIMKLQVRNDLVCMEMSVGETMRIPVLAQCFRLSPAGLGGT